MRQLKKLEAKIKSLWVVLGSKSLHIIYQKHPGDQVQTVGFGQGDLRDLVLYSKELKNVYDGFLQMINETATNSGDLHALQQLKEAVDVIEEPNNVGH